MIRHTRIWAMVLTSVPFGAYFLAGMPTDLWRALFFYGCLACLSVIDMETRRLPNPLTGLLFIAGMLQAYMYGYFEAALYGALIGGVGLWLVAYVYQLLRKRRGMGMGDVKLLGAMGAWTGPFAIPYILLIASVTGIVFAYLYSLRDAEKRGALQAYPFGPFLALGGWIAFLILAA